MFSIFKIRRAHRVGICRARKASLSEHGRLQYVFKVENNHIDAFRVKLDTTLPTLGNEPRQGSFAMPDGGKPKAIAFRHAKLGKPISVARKLSLVTMAKGNKRKCSKNKHMFRAVLGAFTLWRTKKRSIRVFFMCEILPWDHHKRVFDRSSGFTRKNPAGGVLL